MKYELEGKLIEKFDPIQRSEKFKVREFIVEEVRQAGSSTFTNVIKFQLNNDKCSLIDNIEKGTERKVHFNISGRSWEKEGKVSYFTNLEAWKIESVAASSGLTTENLPEIPADFETPPL